jgi:hypothetical protein
MQVMDALLRPAATALQAQVDQQQQQGAAPAAPLGDDVSDDGMQM